MTNTVVRVQSFVRGVDIPRWSICPSDHKHRMQLPFGEIYVSLITFAAEGRNFVKFS